MVHPTKLIFIIMPKHNIRNEDNSGHNPSNDSKPEDPQFLLDEGLDKDHPKIATFTQHPEVGCEHQVGGEDVQHATPDVIPRPDGRIEKHKIIPEIEISRSLFSHLC
jgi:hypothetical protein